MKITISNKSLSLTREQGNKLLLLLPLLSKKKKSDIKRMHSFGYRANALLTFALTILALMCAIASFSDNFNFPYPSAQIQVPLSFRRFNVV